MGTNILISSYHYEMPLGNGCIFISGGGDLSDPTPCDWNIESLLLCG